MLAMRRAFHPSAAGALNGRALCALVLLSGAASAFAGANDQPNLAQPITNKFLVVLDPGQEESAVLESLARAGYATTERILGLPPYLSSYRLVQVPAASPAEKAQLMAVPGVTAVRPVFLDTNAKQPYPILANGQVVARFKKGTPFSDVTNAAEQANCTLARAIDGLPDAYVFNVDEHQIDPYQAANLLRAADGARFAHASTFFKLQRHQVDDVIEDPLYPYQWHLRNTGQLPGGVSGADLNAVPAWQITKGEGAIVAIVDDCLQRDHEDLKDNYYTGYDFVRRTGDPSPYFGPYDGALTGDGFDTLGDFHGTCVAGIIAARDNRVGVRGVAPRASLIGCKIGFGIAYSLDQDIADAFLFAERNGAMAINNSWGGPGGALLPMVSSTDLYFPDVLSDTIEQVSTQGRSGRGVLVLYSAGNDFVLTTFGNAFAGLKHVMAISATMRDDSLSCYSNYGPEISVSAPGGGIGGFNGFGGCYDSDIATTDVTEVTGYLPYVYVPPPGTVRYPIQTWPIRGINEPMKFLDVLSSFTCPYVLVGWTGNQPFWPCAPLVPDTTISDFPQTSYTHHMNGTSSACPNATGVAALVFSMNPTLSAREARNLIEHTAKKVQAPNEFFDVVTGHNDRYGHGRVDAYEAVLAARAGHNWPSPVEDVQNVSSQSLVRLFWTNPDWDGNEVTDDDVAGVLVVRGPMGSLNWAPTDGITYDVGQQVAPSVVVVANDLTTTLDQTGLPQGEFEYAIFVRNPANYYSWGRRANFDSTGAVTVPLASIQPSVTTGSAPLAVHFAGGGVDPTGIVGLAWNFGDGSTGSGAAIDHTYTTAGLHTVTLTVTNRVGQTAQTTVVISVLAGADALPVAQISANPNTGQAPLVVLFEGAATDADGTVVRYDWDFGDGSTATGRVVEHVYLDPGTYGVTLTAVDNAAGQGMASALITVTSGTTTAADTVEATSAAPGGLLAICGSGASGAAIASLIGLCGLMGLRRRG